MWVWVWVCVGVGVGVCWCVWVNSVSHPITVHPLPFIFLFRERAPRTSFFSTRFSALSPSSSSNTPCRKRKAKRSKKSNARSAEHSG